MRVEFQRFGGLYPALMNRVPRYVAELSPSEAEEVRKLVPPDFASLGESAERRRPDSFSYNIVIDDGKGAHQVTLQESDVPASLRPLIDWLSARAAT
jgi:hypothetical protein